MITQNVSVSLTPNPDIKNDDNGDWANIEQAYIAAEPDPFANLYDTYRMLINAQSGLTAHNYNADCNITVTEDEIIIPLFVYVWPSRMDLNYSLKLPQNAFADPKKIINVDVEETITVPLSDHYDFDSIVDIGSLVYETECRNKYGAEINRSEIEIEDTKLILDEELFVVFRIKYQKIGYLHPITLVFKNITSEIEDIKEGTTVYNSDTKIFLRYKIHPEDDGEANKELILRLPSSLNNCLAQCEDGNLINYGLARLGRPEEPGKPVTWTDVYYSACKGLILDVNRREV